MCTRLSAKGESQLRQACISNIPMNAAKGPRGATPPGSGPLSAEDLRYDRQEGGLCPYRLQPRCGEPQHLNPRPWLRELSAIGGRHRFPSILSSAYAITSLASGTSRARPFPLVAKVSSGHLEPCTHGAVQDTCSTEFVLTLPPWIILSSHASSVCGLTYNAVIAKVS